MSNKSPQDQVPTSRGHYAHRRNFQTLRNAKPLTYTQDHYYFSPTDTTTLEYLLGSARYVSEVETHMYECIATLREELGTYIFASVPAILKLKQLEIWNMHIAGMTQVAIAKACGGVHQTCVHKSLYGNTVYFPDGSQKQYGGSYQKIQKWCKRDPTIAAHWAAIAAAYTL